MPFSHGTAVITVSKEKLKDIGLAIFPTSYADILFFYAKTSVELSLRVNMTTTGPEVKILETN
jgi:hypothetical protein